MRAGYCRALSASWMRTEHRGVTRRNHIDRIAGHRRDRMRGGQTPCRSRPTARARSDKSRRIRAHFAAHRFHTQNVVYDLQLLDLVIEPADFRSLPVSWRPHSFAFCSHMRLMMAIALPRSCRLSSATFSCAIAAAPSLLRRPSERRHRESSGTTGRLPPAHSPCPLHLSL